MPQDAVFSELEETCVHLELIVKILKKLNPLNIIMYLDACRAATQGGKGIVIIGTDRLYMIGSRALSPEFVASLIIRSLVKNIEEYLGIKPRKVLASVPANFSIVQTNALARAYEFADVDLQRIIGEPCAAAVLLHKDGFVNSATYNNTSRVIVIDLGGGTLDVSVLFMGDGVFEVEAVSGDNNLGGLDYDQKLVEYIITKMRQDEKFSNYELTEGELEQIRFEAERAKISLGSGLFTNVLLNFEVEGVGLNSFELALDRGTFRQVTELLNQRVEACIQKALEIAGDIPNYIDTQYVLLAGQGSKAFAVREIIGRLFPKIPLIEQYQENAVGLGLCLYTGVLEGIVKDLVLLDTNYTIIRTKCFLEDDPEVDFTVSGIQSENVHSVDLLPLSQTIPTLKVFEMKLIHNVSSNFNLELTEAGTSDGVEDTVIGHIPVMACQDNDTIFIILDVDSNRTILVSIVGLAAKSIQIYQLNNFYRSDVSFSIKQLGELHRYHGNFPSSFDDYRIDSIRSIINVRNMTD